MSILPRYGLLQLRNSARIYTKDVEESLRLFKEETKNLKASLFICFHPDEKEELDSAINFLKNFGVLIYADWLDDSMDKDKSDATSQRLQEQIKENKKFIFLGTEAAIASKWCNWILRLANTLKPIEDIAILPVREDFTDYSGEELIKKYAYIHENDYTPLAYDVTTVNGETLELATWLQS